MLVWAVVDHILGRGRVLRAHLFNELLVLREEEREGHQQLEVRDPLFQSNRQLVLAVCLDPQGSWLLLAGNDGISVLDAGEQIGIFRRGLRVDGSAPGIDEVLGRNWVPVGPLGVSSSK